MHDIHSIDSRSDFGRLFTGDGDRRLRLHHHDIKCPRCDSSNTKFCYYNNYNLSQPRHLCKNCRRYWTKGGVLRNVPVGGGVRKTKRSDKSKPKLTNNVHNSSHSENLNSDITSSLTTNTTANTTNTQFINFSESSTKSAKSEMLTEGNTLSKEVAAVDVFQLNQHNGVQWIDRTPIFNDQCEDDQGLFDLTERVDDPSYWSQSQWNENDQHDYFP